MAQCWGFLYSEQKLKRPRVSEEQRTEGCLSTELTQQAAGTSGSQNPGMSPGGWRVGTAAAVAALLLRSQQKGGEREGDACGS